MIGTKPLEQQGDFFKTRLKQMLNLDHPLCQLGNQINWADIESSLESYYSGSGRPSVPVRSMVGMLLLKQMHNESDESVVDRWIENPYWQYFTGETHFQTSKPFDPSDFVHFRKRIGEKGIEKLLEASIRIHGKKAEQAEVCIDTTVQEKNITYPTDVKQYKKIIECCRKISGKHDIELRQSYRRVVKKLMLTQRWADHPKNRKKARAGMRKLRTIAGRLVREINRKLPAEVKVFYRKQINLFNKVVDQQPKDKNKIYSLHEPETHCISKGKAHKKYEFGTKASIVLTKDTGIIVGALNVGKAYDGHTLEAVLDQTESLVGKRPKAGIVDRGYQGPKKVGTTEIIRPKPLPTGANNYQKQKQRKRFRRRAGIEPIISHLKHDHRMIRNFLSGAIGDGINIMLAATAFNLKKWMRDFFDLIFSMANKTLQILISNSKLNFYQSSIK